MGAEVALSDQFGVPRAAVMPWSDEPQIPSPGDIVRLMKRAFHLTRLLCAGLRMCEPRHLCLRNPRADWRSGLRQ